MFLKKEKVAYRDDLEKVFSDNKIRRHAKTKNLLNNLIKDEETAELALQCRKGERVGIMVVTDQRVIWGSLIAGMPDTYTLSRDEVTGLDTETNAANLVTFTINQAGQKTTFDYAGKKPVMSLIKLIS